MNCFSCFYFHEKKKTPKDSDNSRRRNGELTGRDNNKTHPGELSKKSKQNFQMFQCLYIRVFISLDVWSLQRFQTRLEMSRTRTMMQKKK